MSAAAVLVDGVACDRIAATDRGLAFGDGVFRTLAVRGGRPLNWARHYRRLAADCATLRLAVPAEELLLEAGSRRIHAAYAPGRVEYRVIAPADIGLARIGHHGFFRNLGEPRLWPLVKDWLDARVAAFQPAPPTPA